MKNKCTGAIYGQVGFHNSPQLASSDPSAQSGSSSQTQSLEMQCMEALHWNWSGEQVLSAADKQIRGERERGGLKLRKLEKVQACAKVL